MAIPAMLESWATIWLNQFGPEAPLSSILALEAARGTPREIRVLCVLGAFAVER